MYNQIIKILEKILGFSVGTILVLMLLLWVGHYNIGVNLITNNWVTYNSEIYNFKIDYPGRWELFTARPRGFHGRIYEVSRFLKPRLFLIPIGHIVEVTVDVKPVVNPAWEDLVVWGEDLADSEDKTFPQNGDFEQINGQRIYRRTFYYSHRGRTFGVSEVYFLQAENVFLIRLGANKQHHDDFLDDFEKVVDSFEILD